MELVKEALLRVELGETLNVGKGPLGHRFAVDLTGGWVKGDRLNGDVVGPGGDWAVVGRDGFNRLDVRTQIRTEDGAVIYAQYPGVLEMNAAAGKAMMSDGATDFDDQYFRTLVTLESGDERYAWVNQSVFVGRGRVWEGGVEYELYRVT
jgi:hypothetical protein